MAVLATLMAIGANTSIAQVLNSPFGSFSPGVYVEDESNLISIYSLASAIQILDTASSIKFGDDTELEDVNFFFSSGENFILENRVSAKAIAQLPEELSIRVLEQKTNSRNCYVQGYEVDGQVIVISVHDRKFHSDNNIFKCFTAAVWYFKHTNINEFDPSRWRLELTKLLADELN